jgi:hypothetical protein
MADKNNSKRFCFFENSADNFRRTIVIIVKPFFCVCLMEVSTNGKEEKSEEKSQEEKIA